MYRNINVPLFVNFESGVLRDIPRVLRENNLFFDDVCIIARGSGQRLAADFEILSQFSKASIVDPSQFDRIVDLRSHVSRAAPHLLLSIGGGAVSDLTKYLSMETGIPAIVVPTTLSNDGICSPVSVLTDNQRVWSIGSTMPRGILADPQVLARSPTELLIAGLGDLMSNLSAACDWDLAWRDRGEKVDFLAKTLAMSAAQTVLDRADTYASVTDSRLLEDLFKGLVLSGISMAMAHSSRPASGAEHNFSHALDHVLGADRKAHGRQVGWATLFTLKLHGEHETAARLGRLYAKLGFPLSVAELGIGMDALDEAVALAPRIRDRYTILSKRDDLKEALREHVQ